jgi:threonine/homoserine/homoserine lactone efflux protein
VFETLPTLAAGAVFGLALAAPPGPMNAVIAEESVLRGWLAGFKAGLGAGLADFAFFLLAVAGVVGFVQRYPTVQAVLFGFGGLLMLYFAYGAAIGARSSFAPISVDGDERSSAGSQTQSDDARTGTATDPVGHRATGFRRAFVLALTNPYQILFWLTAGVGLLDPGSLDVLAMTPYVGDALTGMLIVETGSAMLVIGFFGGIALWLLCFPAALVTAGRRVESFAPVVAAASALVLGGFGVVFLSEAWGMFA